MELAYNKEARSGLGENRIDSERDDGFNRPVVYTVATTRCRIEDPEKCLFCGLGAHRVPEMVSAPRGVPSAMLRVISSLLVLHSDQQRSQSI
jgi:hypothetical protein